MQSVYNAGNTGVDCAFSSKPLQSSGNTEPNFFGQEHNVHCGNGLAIGCVESRVGGHSSLFAPGVRYVVQGAA